MFTKRQMTPDMVYGILYNHFLSRESRKFTLKYSKKEENEKSILNPFYQLTYRTLDFSSL